MEDLERPGLEVEYADLSRVDDGPDRVQGGAVVLLVELPVLHEALGPHVLLELTPGHEVVVLTVDLTLALCSGGICLKKRE